MKWAVFQTENQMYCLKVCALLRPLSAWTPATRKTKKNPYQYQNVLRNSI